ncbi:hypothetical protein J6590_047638 [Homalodisca vitripennis]|nr:hypothetical protein J6590_047638 [Homalodisca vitripennis]
MARRLIFVDSKVVTEANPPVDSEKDLHLVEMSKKCKEFNSENFGSLQTTMTPYSTSQKGNHNLVAKVHKTELLFANKQSAVVSIPAGTLRHPIASIGSDPQLLFSNICSARLQTVPLRSIKVTLSWKRFSPVSGNIREAIMLLTL